MRGSPAGSVRPGQTGHSWLGVKGSRVQIPPSRLVRQVFGFNFREPIGEPMAFPEQGQASSVAFAFRVRFTAVALSVRAGPDLVTVDRLGDRRAGVPDQVGDVLQPDIVRAEEDTNECHSSRGVPPGRGALVIFWNSFARASGPAAFHPRGRTRDRALATSPPLRAVRRPGGCGARGAPEPPQQVCMNGPARRALTAGGHGGRSPCSAALARSRTSLAQRVPRLSPTRSMVAFQDGWLCTFFPYLSVHVREYTDKDLRRAPSSQAKGTFLYDGQGGRVTRNVMGGRASGSLGVLVPAGKGLADLLPRQHCWPIRATFMLR